MSNTAASSLITTAANFANIDTSSTSKPGLQSTTLLTILDQADREARRVFRRSGGEPPLTVMGETGFRIIANTTVSAASVDTSIGATTLLVSDSSSFYSSGAIAVLRRTMPDFVTYTGNSANTFTGIPSSGTASLTVQHQDGDIVLQLYPMPADFQTFRSQDYNIEGVRVNGLPYTYTTNFPLGLHYSLFDTGITKYLYLPFGASGDCMVSYNKTAGGITLTTDQVSLIPDYDFFYVGRLFAHMLRTLAGGETNASAAADKKADAILKESQQEQRIHKIAKTRMIQGRRNSDYIFFVSQIRQ